MKHSLSTFTRAGLLALPLAVTGCSMFTTTTDGVTSAFNSVTDTISSTTGSKSAGAFVGTRFAAIRFEAAKGEGEHLDSLAQLLGETDRPAFARFMKDNYARLFEGLSEPQELVSRIELYRGARLAESAGNQDIQG